jgi:hypothetical protein
MLKMNGQAPGQRQPSFFMEGEQFYVTKEERDIEVMVANMLKPSAQYAKAHWLS